ncbi:MAG TPA: UDP-N-acetylmuramate dehydrogenase [Acidobacteriota bacterium]|nr:UDP-N-acetylmuramate dehydrogenase [Acidobacteriota bacterium]
MLATQPLIEGESWNEAALRAIERTARENGWRWRHDEPLERHTSMGVGGPCPIMLWPRHRADVRSMVAWMGSRRLPWHVLGGGSNLLVADKGVDEPVINMTSGADQMSLDSNVLRVSASLPTARALRYSVAQGLDGLVWSAGLPGTIGGAASGNAGCWGGDMQSCTADIDVVDSCGLAHRIESADLVWGYRNLNMPGIPAPWTIIAVGVQVEQGDATQLAERYDDLQRRKRERQPVGARNSGCIFRNPQHGEGAGQLIDAAGCKGLRVGNAAVSDHHANFIVNLGGARAHDIEELVDRLVKRVHAHSGTLLEPEIRRW